MENLEIARQQRRAELEPLQVGSAARLVEVGGEDRGAQVSEAPDELDADGA